jgi:hypothetical protein
MDPIDHPFTTSSKQEQLRPALVPENGSGSLRAPGRDPGEPEIGEIALTRDTVEDEREIRETDRPQDQAVIAEEKIAARNEAIRELAAKQGRIGDKLMIERIRASGLCDLAPSLVRASYGLASLDTVCWYASLSYLLAVPGLWRLALVPLAITIVVGLWRIAQAILGSELRDVTSVTRTIRIHRQMLRRIGTITGVGVASFFVLALLPSKLARWVLALSAFPVLLCNLGLPLLATVARSFGYYLEKPALWDALEHEIAAHRAAIRRFQRYLPAPKPPDDDGPPSAPGAAMRVVAMSLFVTALLVISSGGVRAAEPERDTCFDIVDLTNSGADSDQDTGREFFAASAIEQAEAAGCRLIAVGFIGDRGRLGPRTWVVVPKAPDDHQCEITSSETPQGEQGVARFFRHVQEGQADECHDRVERSRKRYDLEIKQVQATLRRALSTPSTREWSRIRDAIQGAADSPRARVVAVLTDGLENPAGPVHVRVPEGVAVIMVITRPADASRYSVVTTSAGRWAAEPGFAVFSVGDLGPGFWASALRAR